MLSKLDSVDTLVCYVKSNQAKTKHLSVSLNLMMVFLLLPVLLDSALVENRGLDWPSSY